MSDLSIEETLAALEQQREMIITAMREYAAENGLSTADFAYIHNRIMDVFVSLTRAVMHERLRQHRPDAADQDIIRWVEQ